MLYNSSIITKMNNSSKIWLVIRPNMITRIKYKNVFYCEYMMQITL